MEKLLTISSCSIPKFPNAAVSFHEQDIFKKKIAKEEIILVEMMSELLTASPASDSFFIDSHAPCFWMTSIILPSTHVDPLEPGSLHITDFDIKIHALRCIRRRLSQ